MMLDWMMVEGYKKLKEQAQQRKLNNERNGDVKHLNLPSRQRTRREPEETGYRMDNRYIPSPTPGTRGRSSLRSSEQGLLFVNFALTSTTQANAFSVVGPSVWNGLPLSQRFLPRILSDTFYSSLKTLLFSRARVGSASE